jgi:hypothetical protein
MTDTARYGTERSRQLRGALRSRLLAAVGAAAVLGGCGPDYYEQVCAPPTESGCRSAEELEDLAAGNAGCKEVVSVEGPEPGPNGSCCYEVGYDDNCPDDDGAVAGRPFTQADGHLLAGLRDGDHGWAGDAASAEADADLGAEERALLAAAWSQSALAEHASVASFARVALELMAVAAPAELVAEAHRAALDEVRHATVCFALAARYGQASVSPGPISFGGSVALRDELRSLAVATVLEGCVNETLAALLAAEQLARCSDAQVSAALATIAEDEARHAELAWRTVAWAMATGGEPVRAAVSAAFAGALRDVPAGFLAGPAAPRARSARLVAHGLLPDAQVRHLLAAALRDVVAPAATALLRQPSPQPRDLQQPSLQQPS